jgi:hypothetical protein
MMKIFAAVLLLSLAGVTGSAFAGKYGAVPLVRADPLYYMSATTPALALSERANLIQRIWGQAFIPRPAPSNISSGTAQRENVLAVFGRTPITNQWLGYKLAKLPNIGNGNGLWTRVYYATFPGATCLVIINAGHSEGFFNPGNLPELANRYFNIPSVDALVKSIAAKPCDVLLNSMLFDGENRFAAAYVGLPPDPESGPPGDHDTFGENREFAPSNGSVLQYFLQSGLAALDYAMSQKHYDVVAAVGISGGGWTTTMQAALEPRITRSYAIAGSVPLSYRFPDPEGDWEQYNVPADYLDLYAMSVAEAGRRSFLFYNGQDGCCFKFDEVEPWAKALRERIATSFPSTLSIMVDSISKDHAVTDGMTQVILNDLAN